MTPSWVGRVLLRIVRQIRADRGISPYLRTLVRLHLEVAWHRTRPRVQSWLRGPAYLAAAGRARAAGTSVARVDGSWQTVVDVDLSSVRAVAEDNLAAAAALLDAAGVPFFVRDTDGPGGIVIGVDPVHRAAAFSALATADARAQLYARDAGGGRPVPLRAVARSLATRRAQRLLVYRNQRLGGTFTVGTSHACVLEVWQRTGENLRPPRGAVPARIVPAESTPAELTVAGRTYPTLSPIAEHRALRGAHFPIDIVYTWVDDTDPEWRAQLDETRRQFGHEPLHEQSANVSRYRNRDELRYSLRSVALFAPFVRSIFIVTAGQVPHWLADHPAVRIVDHTEIFDPSDLPTFNSHSIESRLHHIDGLAEHYLYLNDDFLFGREVAPTTFFTPNGLAKVLPDEHAPVPAGPPSAEDRPVDSASKRVRDLLLAELGVRVGRKMLHVPYPQLRSVLFEMEERFATEFARTASSRFRHRDDINVASNFSHYYAFATGRAVPGEIMSTYIDIGRATARLQLRQLVQRRDRDVVCINDTVVPDERLAQLDEVVGSFLEEFLPVRSPFERPPAAASGVQAHERDHVGEGVDGR